MLAVGEDVEPGADEIEQTDFDYPMRNVWQISQSQGVFVLTGGDGALEEILPALIDYELPVGMVRGSGPASIAVERLLDLFPEWENLLVIGENVTSIVDEFSTRVQASATHPG